MLAAAIFSTPYYAAAVTGKPGVEGGLIYGGGQFLGARRRRLAPTPRPPPPPPAPSPNRQNSSEPQPQHIG